MPKAILEFNLPEEDNDYKLATNGHSYWSCLWNLMYDLDGVRSYLKYGHKFKDADEVLEWVQNYIIDRVDLEEIS
jgi:hypothetical protein